MRETRKPAFRDALCVYTHTVACGLTRGPVEHFWQLVWSSVGSKPEAHVEQVVAPASDAYVPEVHCVQVVEPEASL